MNISFAGPNSSSTLQNAVDYAWKKGAVIFASAGNYSTSTLYYPAACNNVVAVSATTSSDTLASFSNYGSWVDVAAPGVSIYTTANGGGYRSASGTSFSSPIAAGLGALIMSANPSLTNTQVVEILKKNADNLGSYARINVYKSLAEARSATPLLDSSPPIVSISSPSNGANICGGVTVNVSATDDVGVSKVELYINGNLYASDTTVLYSFYWDTKNYSNGTYTLEAVAYDGSGNIGESNLVTVNVDNVKDTIPPVVFISSPPEGTPVSKKVTINVTASDNVGISKIQLFIDGVLKSTVSSSTSLSYNWNTNRVLRGPHVISSKAYDSAGNVGTHSITVYK